MADEMTFVENVRAYMAAHHMTREGDRILVGFSGGADSLCLLEILREMAETGKFSVSAMHVNHGIRGAEAMRDEDFAREFCKIRNIPFYCVRVDVPSYAAKNHLSEEEAARLLRYEAFDRVMKEQHMTKLALAHHENDLAETMLYNMARGTGLAGLCSLKPVRNDRIRPLLVCTREAIEAEVRRRGLHYVTDSTNETDDHTRNRLRHTVVPALTESVNAGALRHMRELSENAAEILDFVSLEAEERLSQYCPAFKDEDKRALVIENAFFDCHPAVWAEGMRLAACRVSGTRKDFSRCHVEALYDLALGESGRQGHFPGGLLAEKRADGLYLTRHKGGKETKDDDQEAGGEDGYIELNIPGETVYGEWRFIAEITDDVPISIPENAYTKWLDYDRMKGALRLRRRKAGDKLTINEAGGHKSLSDYLTDRKIPSKLRDDLTLLCDEEEVVWIVGHRIGAVYKVSNQTKRVLKISAGLLSDQA